MKDAARSIVAVAIQIARRMDPASGAFEIMEGLIAALEAENEALQKMLASQSTAEKSSETAQLVAIERKVEEPGPSLIRLVEERLENIKRKREKDETTRRVESGVSNTAATKEGKAVAMDWQIVERRNKKKKVSAKKQPATLTPGTSSIFSGNGCFPRIEFHTVPGHRIGEIETTYAIRAMRGIGLRVSPANSKAIWSTTRKGEGFLLPSEQKHDRRNRRTGIADEIPGSRHRQSVDVRAALRLPDSQDVDDCQCLVRPAAEHRWSSSRGTPTIQGVVRSRVMYGAPVWADDLMISRRRLLLLRRLHRVTAITIIRGYRTISHASATVLAALPPYHGSFGRWRSRKNAFE